MCMLIYSPNGQIPKVHLQRALTDNKDGWGLWVGEHKVTVPGRVFRGLTVASFWETWGKLDPHAPKVFHARLATHGAATLENVHPFACSPHADTYLFHNGIISYEGNEDKTRSDTARFAALLGKIPREALTVHAFRALVGSAIGKQNKLALVVAGRVCLINESSGVWNRKVWYSNEGFKSSRWDHAVEVWLNGKKHTYSGIVPPASVPSRTPNYMEDWRKYQTWSLGGKEDQALD